ncbi:DUF2491 domain-containing protein, partial [Salmonella enterica subsp. enterica]|nr:DUF2491 domain-containing protein [Salmonella enterica subsp. salamae]
MARDRGSPMMQFFQRLLGKTSAPAPIRGPLGL